MNDKKPWMIVAVRLAVVGVGAYLWLRKPPPETPLPVVAPPAVPVASVVAPSPAVEALPILHPLDAPPPAQPLPSLTCFCPWVPVGVSWGEVLVPSSRLKLSSVN